MIFRPLIYVLSLIGLTVIVGSIIYLVERFTGFNVGNSGGSVVVPMITALIEGQAYAKRENGSPAKSDMWVAALGMSVISSVLSFGILALMSVTIAPDLLRFLDLGTGIMVGAFAAVFVSSLLLSRIGYGLGVKSQLRARQ